MNFAPGSVTPESVASEIVFKRARKGSFEISSNPTSGASMSSIKLTSSIAEYFPCSLTTRALIKCLLLPHLSVFKSLLGIKFQSFLST